MSAPTTLPRDYLGYVDAKLVLDGQDVPLTLDIYGHRVTTASDPTGYFVVDRVVTAGADVSSQLPSEALEVLTGYVNRPKA